MNCVIPGTNLKVLSRIIQAFTRISTEIQLTATQDGLSFRGVNAYTTVYCNVNFFQSFFSSYELEESESQSPLTCFIGIKGLLSIFKHHAFKDMHAQPVFCRIELDYNATQIVFKFKYKQDVVTLQTLHLNEGNMISSIGNVFSDKCNQLSATAQLLTQVLINFQLNNTDLGLEVTKDKALMRNYITGSSKSSQGVRSQLTLNSGEFNNFQVHQDTSITFCLKTLRAAIQLAEFLNLHVVLKFERPGKPCLVTIGSPIFEATFVLSTLRSDDFIQSTLGTSNPVSLSQKDQEALSNIDWDNDFTEPMQQEEPPVIEQQATTSRKRQRSPDEIENDNREAENMEVDQTPNGKVSKLVKTVFGRCYETTFHQTMQDFGEVLVPDSDPDSD